MSAENLQPVLPAKSKSVSESESALDLDGITTDLDAIADEGNISDQEVAMADEIPAYDADQKQLNSNSAGSDMEPGKGKAPSSTDSPTDPGGDQYGDMDEAQLKFLGSVWTVCLVVMIGVLTIIFIVIVASTDETTDDTDYLESISFPLSAGFLIASYNDPTNDSSSIISRPRALRAAEYDGATLLYVGSASSADMAFLLIDSDSDGDVDSERVIFESISINSTYAAASLALTADDSLLIATADALALCDGGDDYENVHEEALALSDDDRLTCTKIMDIPLSESDENAPYLVYRYIGVSPYTDTLCMANGVTCNVYDCSDADLAFPHGTITCFNDSSVEAMMATNMSDPYDPNIIIKAEGVRNSVGFDWFWNGYEEVFYFTDNGRDEIHPNYPDDELNLVRGSGNNHYGFPLCHNLGSGDIADRACGCASAYVDPEFPNVTVSECAEGYVQAMQALGPHVVPLGLRVYNGSMFPEDFQNTILIAERGSGDTSEVNYGYRVAVVQLSEDGTRAVHHSVFADGWFDYDENTYSGRPVDVEVLPDGSVVVANDPWVFSDQRDGGIYRVTYNNTDSDRTEEEIFDTDVASYLSECDYSYVEDD